MSIKLMAKAWETNQKGNDLLVLLAICDYASDEGVLFPSLKTLGKKAKVSKSTLAYILKAYESIGVITRDKRKRENGSNTSTMYKINHLNVDVNKFKEAYQKARKYTKKPQCGQGENKMKNEIVDNQNANCGQLEPSYSNHHIINNITPKKVITYYSKNISYKQEKILEQTSYTQLAMNHKVLEKIYIGLTNYKNKLPKDSPYIKTLPSFIKNKIYLDYQEEEQTEWKDSYEGSNDDWK